MSRDDRYRVGIYADWHNPDSIPNYKAKIVPGTTFIMLPQYPSPNHRFIIKDFIQVDNRDDIKKENEFWVDYKEGFVYFHPSLQDTWITIKEFYGIGINRIDAKRVVTKLDATGNVVQVLQDIIDAYKEIFEALANAMQLYKDVQDSLEVLKETQYPTFIVAKNQWTKYIENGITKYKATIEHNLLSKNLHITAIDMTTDMNMGSPPFKYLDLDNIEVYSFEVEDIKYVISAGYYNGLVNNDKTNEILTELYDARLGEPTLKDKIRDMDSQLITEIDNVNSSLEENANDLTTIKRKFKGEFGRNLYWADGASGVVAESKKKEQIEACITAGIDSVVLPIQTKYSDGNLVIVNDLDNDLKWLQYAQSKGLKVSCIKMHNYGYTSDDIANNYTDFKVQYKAIIDTVSTKFQTMNIEIFTVMNEETQYFMGMDNADNSFILDLFTIVKAKGFKVGITTAGYNYSYRVTESIFENSDVICANTYVRIGSKRERTTDLDSIKAWQEDDINMWITYMKGKYPNKEIILSETGCMDYWAGLQTPSSFVYPDELKVTTNNKAVDIYYTGMFETMSEKVDRVWNWFNLPSVDVCNKYLKGGYGNE